MPTDALDDALKKLDASENAKRLTIDLLKASVERWKEESIGASQIEVDRYHGAIIHTRNTIELLEQNVKGFELQNQAYT
ncbi:hypothetical protein EBI00_02485 [Marinomonas hwangdonensis]|uniref:Uncharacterized protein n=1 Tax=Marinomonas hwangdonensis TaxID=1053647 RepID=A0A3M8QAA6_9GAMM|nr:hypothetical protein [Marinomonas hwangdonensis]RNF52987.1 hypothetical protein EBI00_02485 [Marinomonas hwangdonensis]